MMGLNVSRVTFRLLESEVGVKRLKGNKHSDFFDEMRIIVKFSLSPIILLWGNSTSSNFSEKNMKHSM